MTELRTVVGVISRNGMVVQIVDEPGLTGYLFTAVGKESLPLAVELACLQTEKGIGHIDRLMDRGRMRGK